MNKRVAFFVVEDKAFLIQRLNLATFIRDNGYEVHVISPKSELAPQIEKLGFIHHDSKMHRTSLNPLGLLNSLLNVMHIMREIKPDIVHNVSIKPVIFGSILARLVGVPKIVNLVNGLGYLFSEGKKQGLIKRLAIFLYRLALRSPKVHTVFQNPDDKEYFEQLKLVDPKHSYLILGSGVDMQKFAYAENVVQDQVRFLFVSRMLWHKGIQHLIGATRTLKKEGLKFEVWFIGEPDPKNPGSVSPEELKKWEDEGLIKFFGFQSNVNSFFHQTNVSILPSYYREGVPLSLIEAASSGRAIITTDMPGCREIVKNGVNGLIVKPKDTPTLTNAMRDLITHPSKITEMGKASRDRVEKEFRKEIVNQKNLGIYQK